MLNIIQTATNLIIYTGW